MLSRLKINPESDWTNLSVSGKIIPRNYRMLIQKVIGGKTLANIKSQIKRNRQNKKRRDLNRVFRGRARTALRNARLAIDTGVMEEARTATMVATKALDKAAAKGVMHKNKAARQKSRLMQRLNSME